MKLKSSLLLFSFVGVAGLAFFSGSFKSLFKSNEPDPRKEAVLVRSIIEGLNRLHFQPQSIDDKFSQKVYDLYLRDIDGSKRFFTQDDIGAFKQYEKQLDDQANTGDFTFFDLSLQRLNAGILKTQTYYRAILAAPMSFNNNETVEMDGKKLDWPKNDEALRQRWDKMLRYEVLTRVTDELELQEKPDFKGEKKTFAQLEKESREKVLDVYEKWYKRLLKNDRKRWMETYLNAFTNVFDPHTIYLSPQEKEDFDIQMSGKLEGIGARLQSDGEKTTVTEIVPGGPAWKHGELQAKDVILKVAQDQGDAIDVMGWDIDDVVAKIRGPKGTRVTLTVQKPEGAVKTVTLTREVVIMEDGFAKSLLMRNGEQSEKIGYIYLPKFYADFTPQGLTSCAQDVAKEIDKLKQEKVSGIVLDLRGNGGGSLRDVVQMSGLFIERGPIVQVKSRNRKAEVMEDNDPRVQWGGPLLVMVNGFSASASEILAAAMQDYGRAIIVGSSGTYGKGTVQRVFDLDNAVNDESIKPLGGVKLTVQKFYRINGKTTQLDGVEPDIVLPDFYNLIENGESENDYPLQANTIDPVNYDQQVYRTSDLNKLKDASAARVAADPTFKKVSENAVRLKKMRDQSSYPLGAEKYRMWNKRQDEEAAQYDNLFKPIDGFTIENLSADLSKMQGDTSRMARNEGWIKDRKKDIQLYETLRIMLDMIRMDGVAGKQ